MYSKYMVKSLCCFDDNAHCVTSNISQEPSHLYLINKGDAKQTIVDILETRRVSAMSNSDLCC